jgi:hypothetical protein
MVKSLHIRFDAGTTLLRRKPYTKKKKEKKT